MFERVIEVREATEGLNDGAVDHLPGLSLNLRAISDSGAGHSRSYHIASWLGSVFYPLNDYWDGPRRGMVAVRPHIYESPFNTTKDDFEEFFWVQPIDSDLLALVLEDWTFGIDGATPSIVAKPRRKLIRPSREIERVAKAPCVRTYDLRSTYATRLSAGGAANEWVTQLLRQGDAKVFKKYSQMKLRRNREALAKLNRQANEAGPGFGTVEAKEQRKRALDQIRGEALIPDW